MEGNFFSHHIMLIHSLNCCFSIGWRQVSLCIQQRMRRMKASAHSFSAVASHTCIIGILCSVEYCILHKQKLEWIDIFARGGVGERWLLTVSSTREGMPLESINRKRAEDIKYTHQGVKLHLCNGGINKWVRDAVASPLPAGITPPPLLHDCKTWIRQESCQVFQQPGNPPPPFSPVTAEKQLTDGPPLSC